MNEPGKQRSSPRRSLQVKGAIIGALIGTLICGIAGAYIGWVFWNSPQQYYQISGRSNSWGVVLENALPLALGGLITGALLGGMAGAICEHWKSRCGQMEKGSEVAGESGPDK